MGNPVVDEDDGFGASSALFEVELGALDICE
jgi:hypothetical protein